jgi:hypothetical protein
VRVITAPVWGGWIGVPGCPAAFAREPAAGVTRSELVLRDPAALFGVRTVDVLEEGRDAGDREDTLHGVAPVHE